MLLTVRMAAMISRAFVFSPLAMGETGSAPVLVAGAGNWTVLMGVVVVVTAGEDMAFDCWGVCSMLVGPGWGGRSNSDGCWFLGAPTLAVYDGERTPLPCREKAVPGRSEETRRANDPPDP